MRRERDRVRPVGGLGTNLTVMAGLNLGWLGLRPVTIFGNAFARKGTFSLKLRVTTADGMMATSARQVEVRKP